MDKIAYSMVAKLGYKKATAERENLAIQLAAQTGSDYADAKSAILRAIRDHWKATRKTETAIDLLKRKAGRA